jgi:hypothetical protein
MRFTELANNILKSQIQENQETWHGGTDVGGYKRAMYKILDQLLGHLSGANIRETNPEHKALGEKAHKALMEYRNTVIRPPGRQPTTAEVTGNGKYSAD